MTTLIPPASESTSSQGVQMSLYIQRSTWEIMWQRVLDFLFRSDIEYSEFQSCIMMFIWGGWLIFNRVSAGIATVEVVPQSLTALRTILPEWTWCMWFICMGSGHLIALSKNLWSARRFFTFMATFTWLYVAIFLGLTNIRMIAVPTTLFFAIGAAWGFWRLHYSPNHTTRVSSF